jgi:hypothetical protein
MQESQNLSGLHGIQWRVGLIIHERGEPLHADELILDRDILMIKTVASNSYRQEKISCVKNCKGRSYGPYWYGHWRDGGRTGSKYVLKSLRK